MNIYQDTALFILSFLDNPSDEVKALIVIFSIVFVTLIIAIACVLFVQVVYYVKYVRPLKRKILKNGFYGKFN